MNVLPIEHCPNCGGWLTIIAAVLKQPVIESSLNRLEVLARAPPQGAAHG